MVQYFGHLMRRADSLEKTLMLGRIEGTRLSDFTFTFHFHALEKEMAAHSSTLAMRMQT